MRLAVPETAKLVTPYGATETLPVASITPKSSRDSCDEQRGRGVCVGRIAKDVEIWIIKISDEVITSEEDMILVGLAKSAKSVWLLLQ